MAEALTGQTPLFAGATGGLLTKAFEEEKYAITWSSPKSFVFELPTGGSAISREGDNLLYLSRKEHGIALGGQQLRAKHKINNYKIYRVLPGGETALLHPKDGVFPEKVNAGREFNGKIDRNIGSNPNPATVKFSGKTTYQA
jgi:photosystem I subunit II